MASNAKHKIDDGVTEVEQGIHDRLDLSPYESWAAVSVVNHPDQRHGQDQCPILVHRVLPLARVSELRPRNDRGKAQYQSLYTQIVGNLRPPTLFFRFRKSSNDLVINCLLAISGVQGEVGGNFSKGCSLLPSEGDPMGANRTLQSPPDSQKSGVDEPRFRCRPSTHAAIANSGFAAAAGRSLR